MAAGSSETFFSLLIIGDFMGTRDDLHAQQNVLIFSWTDKVAQVTDIWQSICVLIAACACSNCTRAQIASYILNHAVSLPVGLSLLHQGLLPWHHHWNHHRHVSWVRAGHAVLTVWCQECSPSLYDVQARDSSTAPCQRGQSFLGCGRKPVLPWPGHVAHAHKVCLMLQI